jgi:demethylmenaquinone methyltransferase/2-methoxy-6-polyprenyl-1,4-benzoquinol methylase
VLLTVDLERLDISRGDLVLDAGCGEGRHCFGMLGRGARVVGFDLDLDSMRDASKRLRREASAQRGLGEMTQGNIFQLPFADATYDRVICSEVMEHVHSYRDAAKELARVTKPGGNIAILELSEPRAGVMGALARFHVHHVVPNLGAFLSGKREYRYLQRSIAAFPPPDEFVALMNDSGLPDSKAFPLTFGACALFVGTVPS